MILKLKNINQSVKNICIINDFSADFTPGVYGLLGPNGAGKTTLMNIAANVTKPKKGNILWNDQNINLCGDEYRNILGYLPQEIGFYSHFSARDFLRYIGALKGIPKKKLDNRIEELGNIVNLSDVMDKKCGKFSGGMKRRLGVAQALLNNPHLLILDEPTAGLDPMERIRFRNMLSDISNDKIVILSTHIVSDIERISQKIILLNKGEIIKSESVQQITNGINGMVWEVTVEDSRVDEVEKIHTVINFQQRDNGVLVRILSDVQPFPDATLVNPTLEDVYVFYYHSSTKGMQ